MDANDFLPIRVSTLRGGLKISFDAYVNINKKHILLCRKGDSFEGERLTRLKKKKLRKMYILEQDENNYRGYISESIEMAYDKNSGKSLEERGDVVQGSQQAAAEDVIEDPENKAKYEFSKAGTTRYVDFILNEPDALSTILNIKNTEKNIAHHGVTVATIAIELARKIGLDSKPLDLMALGCLLHDLEHNYNELDVGRKIKDFSKEELEVYKSHPRLAAQRLKNTSHVDQVVLDIILNHHELNNGQGFPEGKPEKDLNVTVQVAAIADAYDRYVCFEENDLATAMKMVFTERLGQHNLAHLKSLRSIFVAKKII